MSEIGTPIPYFKLGYKNMDDLLKSMPDVVSSYTNAIDGLLYVKAVPLEGSSHINELVRGQRTSKPKKKKSNGYSLNSKFRGFRVSSQVAPNRNFNKNYNSFKPHERYDNSKTENILRPTYFSVPDNSSNLPPRFMQLNQQTSLLGVPPSTFQVKKPNFSTYNQTGLFHSVSHVVSNNNHNMNNNINQTFGKQQNWVEKETVVLQPSGSSNSTPVIQPQGSSGRAHMTPQLMQPRTPIMLEPNLVENEAIVAPLSVSSNSTPMNKPQGRPGRAHMIPQLMQPRTPVHQAQPVTAESHIVSSTPAKVVLPNPPVGQLSNINPIQKSFANLNISLKSEEPKSLEPTSSARQPNPSTAQSQQFSSPSENRMTDSSYFQWKKVEPKLVQASVKRVSQQFYAPGDVQPAIPRQVCILPEEEPKHVQESLTPASQQCKPPGVIQPSTFDRTSTSAEEAPSRLPEPRPVQQMQPATLTLGPKLHDVILQEPCTPQKVIPSARAPRVLLKNALPIVSSSPSSRQFVYRPDNTVESIPAALPSTSAPRLPPSPSPLLSRRFPYRSSEVQSGPPAIVNNVTSRPSARPTASSDR